MRWLDSITDSMDMNLSKLQEIVKNKGAWHVAVLGVSKSHTQLSDRTTTIIVSLPRFVIVCFVCFCLRPSFQFFATPQTASSQPPLSSTISWSLLRFMVTESVMLPNHLILCYPLLLLPSVFPSIRVYSNESALCFRWSKYWSFSFSISPSNEYSGK